MSDQDNLPQVGHGKAVAASTGNDLSSAGLWSSFQEMAKDPTIDAAKMRTLYDMQKQMVTDIRQEEFNKSKFDAMDAMPTITKNKVVNNKSGKVMYRYSDFKHLYNCVKPILKAQGLILDFDVDEMQGETKMTMLRVAPILRHTNGYIWHGSYMPVPVTAANSAISMTQAAKGAVETGKRTVLISCLGITEDEDPNLIGGSDEQAGIPTGENYDVMLEDATEAASRGTQPFIQFFKGLTSVQKGWMMTNGHYDKLLSDGKNND